MNHSTRGCTDQCYVQGSELCRKPSFLFASSLRRSLDWPESVVCMGECEGGPGCSEQFLPSWQHLQNHSPVLEPWTSDGRWGGPRCGFWPYTLCSHILCSAGLFSGPGWEQGKFILHNEAQQKDNNKRMIHLGTTAASSHGVMTASVVVYFHKAKFPFSMHMSRWVQMGKWFLKM